MPIFLYRQSYEGDKPRQILARLQDCYLPEVIVMTRALNEALCTGKNNNYTYESINEIPKREIYLQVDLSQARKTNRAIAYNLSYKTKNNQREYLAYHQKYGTIRGTVEDSAKGARLFISRITAVWPNAEPVR